MDNFPKPEALLLKALIRAYEELPKLQLADDASRLLPAPPGKRRPRLLVPRRKEALKGRLLFNAIEALDKHGYHGIARACRRAKSPRQIYKEILFKFVVQLEAKGGPIESWPDPSAGHANKESSPKTIEDLFRLWEI